jgi:hypothetical protein
MSINFEPFWARFAELQIKIVNVYCSLVVCMRVRGADRGVVLKCKKQAEDKKRLEINNVMKSF